MSDSDEPVGKPRRNGGSGGPGDVAFILGRVTMVLLVVVVDAVLVG